MAVSLQQYETSVINFLQSCTIIFSPLAKQINMSLESRGIHVDEAAPDTWKYYLNVSGEYHSSDTMMTVISLDTKRKVNFTKEMLAYSPKTRVQYTIGSSYYKSLCTTYPDQTDLIKSILYPVDIGDAISSPDFTLLGWGDGYLEDQERDVILYELREFISYSVTRWYFPFFSYEAYYTWAFWGCFWQALPNAIFAARLKYLHTSSVNSFHIWSYLQSNGIGDYSDILTPQQALFLYRNFRYLLLNRGKQSNLIILVNRLLDTINVGLNGKTVYMNTATNAAVCAWTPEFVSREIPTNNAQSLEEAAPVSMTEMNVALINAGLEVDNDPAYVLEEQIKIGRTPINILPTKLVEIQRLGLDQKYGWLLNNFILDTVVYGITSGIYTPIVDIVDPTTKMSFSLSGKDALILYYYAVHRSIREDPVLLPTTYWPTCAFRNDVSVSSIPESFNYHGFTYPTRSYLSLEDLLNGVSYPQLTVQDPKEFSDVTANLFLILVKYVTYSRVEGNRIALEMFLEYCKKYILQTKPYTFSLDTEPDYATWFTKHKLTALSRDLNSNKNYTTAFDALATAIMTALLPEESPVYRLYAYTNPSTENLYDRLKSLFVQLCSYNIAFLDTDRSISLWFLFNPVVYQITDIQDTKSLSFDPLSETDTIAQNDIIPLSSEALDTELSIDETDIIPVKVDYQDAVSITETHTMHKHVPLTIETSVGSVQDTKRIRLPGLLRAVFITDQPST